MDLSQLQAAGTAAWRLERTGGVPVVFYGSERLLADMDEKVREQAVNVARLPGIVDAVHCMPDAHWGYGFPIGGVAAFDPGQGGVISAGGVGFDISCGVRTLLTGVGIEEIEAVKEELATALLVHIPAGVGSRGRIHLSGAELDDMLRGGAAWAVAQGYGTEADLVRTEERGIMAGANPDMVSTKAKTRQKDEMGTLGSGNHYLEVQRVASIYDEDIAAAFGLVQGQAVVSIHCGSRGLGHQIGTEFLREMAVSAQRHGIFVPDRELACAPLLSDVGRQYLGAMRAGINCALANRQILTDLTRAVFARLVPAARLDLLYDVSHNTCKEEMHMVDGEERVLFVHRKGATRAFGPGRPELPPDLRATGQPVLIGGSMGTASYVLCGTKESMGLAFGSACHGAGRAMSRHQALHQWRGRDLVDDLLRRGIVIRSRSMRGVAEEAPGAYKNVDAVVDAAHAAGLAQKVARLEPLICVKG